MSRSASLLLLLHFAANALLLWMGYYWLGIGESSGTRLVWSFLVATIFVCLAVWLHGATFAYFRASDNSNLTTAFRTTLRNLVPLIVLGVLVLCIYALLEWWHDYSAQPAFKIASYLTLKLRKPIRPSTILRVFNILLWVLRWAVLPIIVLPLAAEMSTRGWSGLRGQSWARAKRPLYWLEVPLLLTCAFWLPFKLIEWVPHVSGFGMEVASFLIRLIIAYLLFIGAWLLAVFVSSGGKPRLSQPKTASSP